MEEILELVNDDNFNYSQEGALREIVDNFVNYYDDDYFRDETIYDQFCILLLILVSVSCCLLFFLLHILFYNLFDRFYFISFIFS